MYSINQILQDSHQRLNACSDSPHLDAQLLLAHTLQVDKTFLFAWPEKIITPEQYRRFQQLLARRLHGEPVAYILGKASFWSMDLKVSKDTLIPRPETESLVELTLASVPNTAQTKLLDLGTGCGAIALALAKERPLWDILASDIAIPALAIAQSNRQHLKLSNITLLQSDWYSQIPPQSFHAIVSNPPYIATNSAYLQQGDLCFEPQQALQSADRGLADLKAIIATASQYLHPGGYLCVEHGYDQQSQVCQLMRQAGFVEISPYRDIYGQPRVVIAEVVN